MGGGPGDASQQEFELAHRFPLPLVLVAGGFARFGSSVWVEYTERRCRDALPFQCQPDLLVKPVPLGSGSGEVSAPAAVVLVLVVSIGFV